MLKKTLVSSFVALIALNAAGASAASVSGALTDTDPTYNRVLSNCSSLSGVGTSVRYDTHAFFVTVSGAFDLNLTGGPDNFLSVYSGAFDPTLPTQNCARADDDSGPGLDAALLNFSLDSGTQYFAVVSAFSNGATFPYTLTIDPTASNTTGGVARFGTITAEAPEPGTLGLLGLGLMGLAAARRRR